ncbi:NAD(P)/FAD-dependent oxidoreductase [Desulfovibrio litoralis]|uniref:Flavoprotein, HI0933 family n=1 Tax=Desulfovibrio litoralis DSM 11393 TaxID=1121455 RepID=A0A1M7STE4_9BACT|nr:aminoacetone oxidase family FAD-binding enzyme [Desulfovibrio litoralis]SHN61644.1 hypothetical protein SAMN02745728_01245 [Desulfovibrio litoralis DSM 11393]
MPKTFDLVILGGGASGLTSAIQSSKKGFSTLLVDHNKSVGQKLCIAGGGFGNVTNRNISYQNYHGENQHFSKSILTRYDSEFIQKFICDFGFELEEREHGQLFLTKPAKQLRDAMLQCAILQGTKLALNENIIAVEKEQNNDCFIVKLEHTEIYAKKLIIALGSPAYPQIGGSSKGVELLKSFGHKIIPFKPVLTPFVMPDNWELKGLQGISLPVKIKIDTRLLPKKEQALHKEYHTDLLFTHNGISGPACLQISLKWKSEMAILINFLPSQNILELISQERDSSQTTKKRQGTQKTLNFLAKLLPQRLVEQLIDTSIAHKKIAELSKNEINILTQRIHAYQANPSSCLGMKKAEAATGGADTKYFSSQTLESKIVSSLYACGEILDVTGELGGYNLHWAFACGFAATEFL